MNKRRILSTSIALVLLFSIACTLSIELSPTPTRISGGNVGGQFRPSDILPSTEQTAESIRPPSTPTEPVPTMTPGNESSSELVEEIRPCSLISVEEAEEILSDTVAPPQEQSGACAYYNANDRVYVMSVSAAQGEQTIGILQGQVMLLGMAGVPVDQTQLDHLKTLAEEQNYQSYFTELEILAQSTPSVTAYILKGKPDLEFWIWLKAGSVRQGSLVMAREQTISNLNLIVHESRSEESTLETLQAIIEKVFQRLPERFIIPSTPNPTPTEPLVPSPTWVVDISTPWTPTIIPTSWVPSPTSVSTYFEQSSYTGDCKKRPANSVCLAFEDGYIWLIFNDSITGWDYAGNWQGRTVRVAFGLYADYYHVLGTNLIMKVDK